jgi:hypothetical protein
MVWKLMDNYQESVSFDKSMEDHIDEWRDYFSNRWYLKNKKYEIILNVGDKVKLSTSSHYIENKFEMV